MKYQEETVEQYWEEKNCSSITLSFHCVSLDLTKMKEGMKYISGTSQVEVRPEENCVELACCTSLSDILHNPEAAFVICFISQRDCIDNG